MQENIDTMKIEDVKELTWNEADVKASRYVRFVQDEQKKLFLKNWKLTEKPDKFNEGALKIFLESEVAQEDGVQVDKILDSSSPRLRTALRKCLEKAEKGTGILVGITKIGEGVDTRYSAVVL